MTQPVRGFLLGKFMPPHAGHQYLCDFASNHCDELTVLVCSLDREPIPGKLRHEWMTRLVPDATVLHCAEEVPQAPEDHPEFWDIWRDLIRRHHPEPIDCVYASEPYGLKLADILSARFVPVDIERSVCPVSGTAVRAAPWGEWDYLTGPARPWFTRSVCLFGPESTGKSTLASRIAQACSTTWVPEHGRAYTEIFGTECAAEDVARIAQGQTAAIEAARMQARGLVVTDTDAVLSAVWSDMLCGHRDAWFSTPFPTCDLYLLTGVDVPWVNDGTRYFADDAVRADFHRRCREELERRRLPYIELDGDWQERFETAIAVIREHFGSMWGTMAGPSRR